MPPNPFVPVPDEVLRAKSWTQGFNEDADNIEARKMARRLADEVLALRTWARVAIPIIDTCHCRIHGHPCSVCLHADAGRALLP